MFEQPKLSERCERLCDGMLWLSLFVAPLFLGGRHPIGRTVLSAFILMAGLLWLASRMAGGRSLKPNVSLGVGWLAILAVGLVALQLLPLSTSWLYRLSPGLPSLLPAWIKDGELHWRVVSMAPGATRQGFVMALTYATFFLLLLQRIRSVEMVQRYLFWIAGSCVSLAVIGFLQFLAGNGRFLWIYEHPTRDPTGMIHGPFQNQNHFGQMMVLGLGPLVWIVVRTIRRDPKNLRGFASDLKYRWLLPAIGLLVVILACLITFSRGAILAAVVSLTVASIGFWRMNLFHRTAVLFISLGVTAVLLLGIAARKDLWDGKVLQSLESEKVTDLSPARMDLWRADLEAHRAFSWLGSGIGSHRFVYRTYLPKDFEVEFAYAESSYIQLLLETGRCGVFLLGCCIVWTLVCAVRVFTQGDESARAMGIACFSGLAGSATQAIVDFVWQIPACCMVAVAFVALLCRLATLVAGQNRQGMQWLPETGTWAIGALVALLAPMLVTTSFPCAKASLAWDEYLRQSDESSREKTDKSPVLSTARKQSMVRLLRRALRSDPGDPRVHERLMLLYWEELLKMDQGALLLELKTNGIEDLEKRRQWISQRMGKQFPLLDQAVSHAERTIAQIPLSGRAYLVRAELLRALRGASFRSAELELMEQARVARPNDPMILLHSGIDSLLQGSWVQAVEYWNRAVQADTQDRFAIARTISQAIPIESILERISLNESLAQRFYFIYRAQENRTAQRLMGERFQKLVAQRRERGEKITGELWRMLSQYHRDFDEYDQAQAAAESLVKLIPNEYSCRYWLAEVAVDNRDFKTALRQIRWCRSRRPESESLAQLEQRVYRLQNELSRQPAYTTSK